MPDWLGDFASLAMAVCVTLETSPITKACVSRHAVACRMPSAYLSHSMRKLDKRVSGFFRASTPWKHWLSSFHIFIEKCHLFASH